MKVKLGDVCDRGSSNLKQSDVINQNGQYPVYGAAGLLGNIDSYHQDKPYVAVVKDGAGIGRVTLHPGYSSVIGTLQYLLPKENVLPEYLYYVTKHMHLEKYYTGATIPHIYFKDYKNEKFNLDAIEKQQRIVEILKKTENIIESRQQELQRLDDLIKARFIELFGEPLSNQKGWQTMSIVEAAPIKSQRGDLGDEVWLLNLDAVEAQTGTVLFKHRVQSGKINASTVFFTTESVLYSKLRPYLNKVVMPNEDGVATSEMIPMYPLADRLNRAYLCYWLRSDAFVRHISEKVAGAKMPRVSMDYFRSLAIELPPLELQGQFADFVAQIDKSKLLSGCRFFHSWVPPKRNNLNHVGVPRRRTKDLRGCRRQHAHLHH